MNLISKKQVLFLFVMLALSLSIIPVFSQGAFAAGASTSPPSTQPILPNNQPTGPTIVTPVVPTYIPPISNPPVPVPDNTSSSVSTPMTCQVTVVLDDSLSNFGDIVINGNAYSNGYQFYTSCNFQYTLKSDAMTNYRYSYWTVDGDGTLSTLYEWNSTHVSATVLTTGPENGGTVYVTAHYGSAYLQLYSSSCSSQSVFEATYHVTATPSVNSYASTNGAPSYESGSYTFQLQTWSTGAQNVLLQLGIGIDNNYLVEWTHIFENTFCF